MWFESRGWLYRGGHGRTILRGPGRAVFGLAQTHLPLGQPGGHVPGLTRRLGLPEKGAQSIRDESLKRGRDAPEATAHCSGKREGLKRILQNFTAKAGGDARERRGKRQIEELEVSSGDGRVHCYRADSGNSCDRVFAPAVGRRRSVSLLAESGEQLGNWVSVLCGVFDWARDRVVGQKALVTELSRRKRCGRPASFDF